MLMDLLLFGEEQIHLMVTSQQMNQHTLNLTLEWLHHGTVMVKDIGNPNCSSCTPNSAYPGNFTVIGNTLYFQADDGAWFGAQLWKTDGTSAGTVMLRSPGITPQELTAIGTILYFTNHDPIYGRELWWFDTTA